jgi:hypothetical protein
VLTPFLEISQIEVDAALPIARDGTFTSVIENVQKFHRKFVCRGSVFDNAYKTDQRLLLARNEYVPIG